MIEKQKNNLSTRDQQQVEQTQIYFFEVDKNFEREIVVVERQ